jgi:hypothetical protein
MFRDTRLMASFEERPAYLAAQLASRGRLCRCGSPVSELELGLLPKFETKSLWREVV